MTKKPTQLIAYTSILVAFAILIPIIMPLKLLLDQLPLLWRAMFLCFWLFLCRFQ